MRVEFLNPLFKAMGWDMDNEQGYAAAYKEVIHEDAVRVSGVIKAPDYAFRIGGVRKFFLEAKKPSVNIKDDIHPAYQLRRYAWSAKLPLSILFADPADVARHDRMVALVEQMLALHKRRAAAQDAPRANRAPGADRRHRSADRPAGV